MINKIDKVVEWVLLITSGLMLLKGEIQLALLFLILSELKELKYKFINTRIKIQISKEEE